MLSRVLCSFCLVFALAGAGTAPLWAQAQPASAGPAASAPSYRVGTITVKFVGTANVNEQVVRANMEVHEGGDLDETILDHDIRALYKTGLFEFIEIKREAVDARTFNLVVELTPKYRVLAVRFEGNKKVTTKRLQKEIKSKSNTALDERLVKDDSEKLKDYYQKAGYSQVVVTYAIQRDRPTGLGTVIYKIREGVKVRIADIRFVGNAHIKAKKLRGEMDTKKWWFLSWLMDTGRLKDEQFQDDLDKLRDYYREQGYLDVEIPEDKVVFDYPKPSRLVIIIAINEGRRYHVGEVTFSGNKLHSSALLKRVVSLHVKPGMVFAPSQIDKGAERIEDYYGRDGYLDTRARVVRTPNLVTNNIDVEFKIEESDKFNVESIEVSGNTKTKSVVIVRALMLGPGDVFDVVRMKISKLALENTRFFEDVTITPQDTNIPGRRNMRVEVKEGRTGAVTFGAGYSSLEKASVFAEVQQSNFDIFNRRSLFQGDGQKFDLKLSLGQLSNEAVLNFEEPFLFQKQLKLGFSIFRESNDYNSNYYQEIDKGVSVYLSKPLFGLVNGTLTYTYEVISIDNVAAAASQLIQGFGGNHDISKISFSLVRDTRDKIISTTSGNYISLNTEVAGGLLGGTDNYYGMEFRGSQFFKLFNFQDQTLSIIARSGVRESYGATKTLPYYDAWYLGGPYDLRGFLYRQVSPRDQFSEPVGGKTYGLLSTEYTIDLSSPVRFAIFYDIGFVNAGAYDFNPGGYNDDFGVGIRLFVAGAPLSLDYAIPLKGDKFNRQGNQFNFSFGTRF